MPNRRERRATKAAARKEPLDPIVAMHEAGHAVGRYLTAADLGVSEDASIAEIVVHGDMKPLGRTWDGKGTLHALATTYGPVFSHEVSEMAEAVHSGDWPDRDALALKKETIARARATGVLDVDRWIEARAVFTVFGPAVEAVARRVGFYDVWDGYEAEGDMQSIVFDATVAGLPVEAIGPLIEKAVERVRGYMQRQEVCDAINALAAHLQRHGTTKGPAAVAIIRKALALADRST